MNTTDRTNVNKAVYNSANFSALGFRASNNKTRGADKFEEIKITYKNPEGLKLATSDNGRILPRRLNGTSAKKQRKLANQIKIARYLALLPYKHSS